MLDWLIVGGGIHGTYLSNFLMNSKLCVHYKTEKILVLDPNDQIMERWNRNTRNSCMDFLRSPRVHHIDLNPNALYEFGKTQKFSNGSMYTDPYFRPSLELFRRHCDSVIYKCKLDKIRIKGLAVSIKKLKHCFEVESTAGFIKSKKIMLSLGMSNQLALPNYVSACEKWDGKICHVFDTKFDSGKIGHDKEIIIIGGGISAAQLAQGLVKKSTNNVTLISRDKFKTYQFDSDPGWIGPKYLNKFQKIDNYSLRREIIDAARQCGSLPPDICESLKNLVSNNLVRFILDEIELVRLTKTKRLEIKLNKTSERLVADRIIFATGFATFRPGGDLIDQLISELGLACAPCGYPVVDKSLQWCPGIFVSGPLAELEIGPVAKNIVGARLTAKRLI